jgi:hypothetical protein
MRGESGRLWRELVARVFAEVGFLDADVAPAVLLLEVVWAVVWLDFVRGLAAGFLVPVAGA